MWGHDVPKTDGKLWGDSPLSEGISCELPSRSGLWARGLVYLLSLAHHLQLQTVWDIPQGIIEIGLDI
ncbi:hypothetical protein RSOLAG1IB_09383 [Rhizoctonia solani AG-1 IB]|uniref:Uncharacterized protein n=1 Tax=Thanatephorus cucumeris (strain AG1-IB / isolate 7/3/14) TaxID=1108050 RepID=A0A0B7FTF0_THACB|nr:hypothetical protein RSOLAG1IB_09383 [Rhizoctonia solani AG-1 IB]